MIPRALAIFAVACLFGAVHLIARGKPILLPRETPVDQPDPGGTIPDDNPADPVLADPATSNPSGTDPYASYASNELFDAVVKPGSITLREAFGLHEQFVTFLDARHEEEFEAGHITGAIWMPSSRLSDGSGLEEAFSIDSTMPIVIYCTGGDCDASENTAVLLQSLNPEFDIRILGKGYDDWNACGLPVEGFDVTPEGGP